MLDRAYKAGGRRGLWIVSHKEAGFVFNSFEPFNDAAKVNMFDDIKKPRPISARLFCYDIVTILKGWRHRLARNFDELIHS